MKNLYTKSEFLNHRNDLEIINEGLLKKMWQGIMKLANKIKGSKEIESKFEEYKKMIDDTFNKFLNIETAKMSGESEGKPAMPTAESVSHILEAETATAALNKEDASNLGNLKPDQIKNISDQTKKRIEQLKTQFETDVNGIIDRLSKNANYSSEKLKQFSIVMKNQLQGYVYDKWYNFYTKVGDKNSILEITKLKKQNEANYKKAVDDLNTKMSEQQQEIEVKTDTKYTYKNSEGKDVEVTVVGKEKGKDEGGNVDNSNPDYANMWKVKTKEDKTFWVSPGSLSKAPDEIEKAPGVDKDSIKVGDIFSYTTNAGDTVLIKVNDVDGKPQLNPTDDGDFQVSTTTTDGKKTYAPRLSRLKPTK